MTYLDFQEINFTIPRKTKGWCVTSKTSGIRLGEIRFYPNWRKYVFFPDANTIYDASCLNEIESKMIIETHEWKEKNKHDSPR